MVDLFNREPQGFISENEELMVVLHALVCKSIKSLCWKSKRFFNGTSTGTKFIIGIETPEGPSVYLYDMSFYDIFDVKELDKSPVDIVSKEYIVGNGEYANTVNRLTSLL